MAEEETETETETETPEEPTPETPASDDEPPAWFKKHLEAEAAKKPKTVAKPTKATVPPVKKSAPAKTETEEPKQKKRSGVSRAWFGSRADND